MGSTNRNTWKAAERRAAATFGALRNVLSGSGGRADRSRSDSTHPRLFLECKYRAKHAACELYRDTAELARKEGKTPVVILFEKGRPGFLIVCRPEDLTALATEYRESTPSGDATCPET